MMILFLEAIASYEDRPFLQSRAIKRVASFEARFVRTIPHRDLSWCSLRVHFVFVVRWPSRGRVTIARYRSAYREAPSR